MSLELDSLAESLCTTCMINESLPLSPISFASSSVFILERDFIIFL